MIAEDAWKDYAAYMRLSAIPLHKRMKYEQFRSHIADERRYEALLKDYTRLNASGWRIFGPISGRTRNSRSKRSRPISALTDELQGRFQPIGWRRKARGRLKLTFVPILAPDAWLKTPTRA